MFLRSRHSIGVVVLAGSLILPARLHAQEDVTGQAWVDFLTGYHVHSNHLLKLKVEPKALFSGGQRWGELTLTPAYEWVAGHRFELVVQTLLSWVRQDDALSTFEIRPVLGFRLYLLKASEHRFMVRDFNRVENRNIRYDNSGDWDTTWRYRNRLEVQIAVNNDHLADDNTAYMLTDAELFVNLGRAAEERFNDSWRFRTGLGYRLKYEWRFELLYMLQIARDTLLADFELTNHIVQSRFKFYPKHSRHQAVAARRARN